MGWLISLFRANWFPYVAIGFTVVVAGASGWAYMKGYSSAKEKYEAAVNKALKEQMKTNQKLANKDMTTLAETLSAEQEVENAIDDIILPEIDPECSAAFVSWMLQFNNAVRATNADTAPTD